MVTTMPTGSMGSTGARSPTSTTNKPSSLSSSNSFVNPRTGKVVILNPGESYSGGNVSKNSGSNSSTSTSNNASGNSASKPIVIDAKTNSFTNPRTGKIVTLAPGEYLSSSGDIGGGNKVLLNDSDFASYMSKTPGILASTSGQVTRADLTPKLIDAKPYMMSVADMNSTVGKVIKSLASPSTTTNSGIAGETPGFDELAFNVRVVDENNMPVQSFNIGGGSYSTNTQSSRLDANELARQRQHNAGLTDAEVKIKNNVVFNPSLGDNPLYTNYYTELGNIDVTKAFNTPKIAADDSSFIGRINKNSQESSNLRGNVVRNVNYGINPVGSERFPDNMLPVKSGSVVLGSNNLNYKWENPKIESKIGLWTEGQGVIKPNFAAKNSNQLFVNKTADANFSDNKIGMFTINSGNVTSSIFSPSKSANIISPGFFVDKEGNFSTPKSGVLMGTEGTIGVTNPGFFTDNEGKFSLTKPNLFTGRESVINVADKSYELFSKKPKTLGNWVQIGGKWMNLDAEVSKSKLPTLTLIDKEPTWSEKLENKFLLNTSGGRSYFDNPSAIGNLFLGSAVRFGESLPKALVDLASLPANAANYLTGFIPGELGNSGRVYQQKINQGIMNMPRSLTTMDVGAIIAGFAIPAALGEGLSVTSKIASKSKWAFMEPTVTSGELIEPIRLKVPGGGYIDFTEFKGAARQDPNWIGKMLGVLPKQELFYGKYKAVRQPVEASELPDNMPKDTRVYRGASKGEVVNVRTGAKVPDQALVDTVDLVTFTKTGKGEGITNSGSKISNVAIVNTEKGPITISNLGMSRGVAEAKNVPLGVEWLDYRGNPLTDKMGNPIKADVGQQLGFRGEMTGAMGQPRVQSLAELEGQLVARIKSGSINVGDVGYDQMVPLTIDVAKSVPKNMLVAKVENIPVDEFFGVNQLGLKNKLLSTAGKKGSITRTPFVGKLNDAFITEVESLAYMKDEGLPKAKTMDYTFEGQSTTKIGKGASKFISDLIDQNTIGKNSGVKVNMPEAAKGELTNYEWMRKKPAAMSKAAKPESAYAKKLRLNKLKSDKSTMSVGGSSKSTNNALENYNAAAFDEEIGVGRGRQQYARMRGFNEEMGGRQGTRGSTKSISEVSPDSVAFGKQNFEMNAKEIIGRQKSTSNFDKLFSDMKITPMVGLASGWSKTLTGQIGSTKNMVGGLGDVKSASSSKVSQVNNINSMIGLGSVTKLLSVQKSAQMTGQKSITEQITGQKSINELTGVSSIPGIPETGQPIGGGFGGLPLGKMPRDESGSGGKRGYKEWLYTNKMKDITGNEFGGKRFNEMLGSDFSKKKIKNLM